MPVRGPYWLTIAQAALELKISTADVRRLIRNGQLPGLGIDAVDVHRVSREPVEYLKQQLAAGHLRIPGRWASGGGGNGHSDPDL
jgi:hypothetical protein